MYFSPLAFPPTHLQVSNIYLNLKKYHFILITIAGLFINELKFETLKKGPFFKGALEQFLF